MLLKPAAFAVMSLFWVITGLLALGPGYQIVVGLMQEGGAGALSSASVIAGAMADMIGIGIAIRWWSPHCALFRDCRLGVLSHRWDCNYAAAVDRSSWSAS